jgi:hypothetical protein
MEIRLIEKWAGKPWGGAKPVSAVVVRVRIYFPANSRGEMERSDSPGCKVFIRLTSQLLQELWIFGVFCLFGTRHCPLFPKGREKPSILDLLGCWNATNPSDDQRSVLAKRYSICWYSLGL